MNQDKIDYGKLVRYTVKTGDTEFSVAEGFKIGVGALREVNKRSAGNYLKEGRKIYIPKLKE